MQKLIAILIIVAMPAGMAIAGSVQCECPSLEAKGTGDTSCSATETGGECTIDFNTFNPRNEEAAFERLKEIGGRDSVRWLRSGVDIGPALTPRDFDKLANDPEALVDLLMIYLMVSAVQTEGSGEFNFDLVDVHARMREQSGNVFSAFAGDGAVVFNASGMDVGIAAGCFEVQGLGYWGMYKAFWSPRVDAAQCGFDF